LGLKGKSFKALRGYQQRKAKEDNDFRVARKFRYATLLQRGLDGLVRAKTLKKRRVHITKEAEQFRRFILLVRAWQLLNGLDEETRERIRCAEKHLRRRYTSKYLPACFKALNNYKIKALHKRHNSALA
jgi:hypothetical protein